MGEILRPSTLVNQYLEETSPGRPSRPIRPPRRALYVALQAINGLKVLWAPVLPFTSQALRDAGRGGERSSANRSCAAMTRRHTAIGADVRRGWGGRSLGTCEHSGREATAAAADALRNWNRTGRAGAGGAVSPAVAPDSYPAAETWAAEPVKTPALRER